MTLVERRATREESQERRFALRANAASRRSTLDSRLGFTLVELLVAILIIGILAAAVLGVAAIAGESAREAKTRNMIARIHKLLNEHYDTYRSRRVKVRLSDSNGIGIQQLIDNAIPTTAQNYSARRRAALAEARLYALREMMVLEIPDRWSDVLLREVPSSPAGYSDGRLPMYLEARTSGATLVNRTPLSQVYLRIYDRIARSGKTKANIEQYQSAECLYMVVVNACGDGEARSQFPESSISDLDNDGAPEFLDGWGRPIEFLRWAPGFNSEIQHNMVELEGMSANQANLAVAADHDPFDIMRLETIAFRLVPLVYSLGANGESGLQTNPAYVTWRTPAATNPTVNPAMERPFFSPRLTPYVKGSPLGPPFHMGTTLAGDRAAAVDNIHNHLISMKPKR